MSPSGCEEMLSLSLKRILGLPVTCPPVVPLDYDSDASTTTSASIEGAAGVTGLTGKGGKGEGRRGEGREEWKELEKTKKKKKEKKSGEEQQWQREEENEIVELNMEQKRSEKKKRVYGREEESPIEVVAKTSGFHENFAKINMLSEGASIPSLSINRDNAKIFISRPYHVLSAAEGAVVAAQLIADTPLTTSTSCYPGSSLQVAAQFASPIFMRSPDPSDVPLSPFCLDAFAN
eukprot:GHVS01080784.1.p1 GENE.GHVS01080784.1~~GHVS01080784.1.p1  ORF type:complete len:234 (+),score=65.22 GHVS01080784.1:155-856(+)